MRRQLVNNQEIATVTMMRILPETKRRSLKNGRSLPSVTDMRNLLFAITVLCLMTACSSKPDKALSPIKVEIEKTAGRYQLVRGGEPYTVRGAGMVVDDNVSSDRRRHRSPCCRARCSARRTAPSSR